MGKHQKVSIMKNIAIGAAAAITIGLVAGHAQAPQPQSTARPRRRLLHRATR